MERVLLQVLVVLHDLHPVRVVPAVLRRRAGGVTRGSRRSGGRKLGWSARPVGRQPRQAGEGEEEEREKSSTLQMIEIYQLVVLVWWMSSWIVNAPV